MLCRRRKGAFHQSPSKALLRQPGTQRTSRRKRQFPKMEALAWPYPKTAVRVNRSLLGFSHSRCGHNTPLAILWSHFHIGVQLLHARARAYARHFSKPFLSCLSGCYSTNSEHGVAGLLATRAAASSSVPCNLLRCVWPERRSQTCPSAALR